MTLNDLDIFQIPFGKDIVPLDTALQHAYQVTEVYVQYSKYWSPSY